MAKNNFSNNEYQEYLEKIHGDKSTPVEIVFDAVKEATGITPTSTPKKLIGGEVNEVYDIEVPGRNNVIVRIHKSDGPSFLQEKWAIDRCNKVGVPTPTILLIKHLKEGDEHMSICVQEKLKGDTLERGRINMWELDPNLLQILMRKSGELLSRIHSIPVEGFDSLDGNGKGKFKTFKDNMLEKPQKTDKYLALAKKLGLPEEKMALALKVIAKGAEQFKNIKPVLNHGDFAPKHIVFEGDEITGILDFGDVLGNSPVFDFARWEYWYGQSMALDALKEGYDDKSIFGKDYQELSRLIQLEMSLGTIWWYNIKNYQKGIRDAVEKMVRLVSFYK